MQRKSIMLLLIAAILLVLGVYLDQIAPGSGAFLRTTLIATSFAIIVATAAIILKERRGEISDERTEKIERASMATSWTLTWVMIAVLILGYQFNVLTSSPPEILALLFFFMVMVEVVVRMFFESRGDVE